VAFDAGTIEATLDVRRNPFNEGLRKAMQDARSAATVDAEKRVKAADAELAAKGAEADAALKAASARALAEIENVAAEAAQEIVAKVSGITVDKAAAEGAVKAALAA